MLSWHRVKLQGIKPSLSDTTKFLNIPKDLRFPPPEQMHSQLDQKAAAYVCQMHSALRNELETLRLHYDQTIERARDYAMRIEETKGKLDELELNVTEFYCDALDALSVPGLEGAIQ